MPPKRCFGCNPAAEISGVIGAPKFGAARVMRKGRPFHKWLSKKSGASPPGWFRPSAINRRFCSLSITARAGITVITREMAAVWKKKKSIPAEKYSEKPIPRRSNSRPTCHFAPRVCVCVQSWVISPDLISSIVTVDGMERWSRIHSTT